MARAAIQTPSAEFLTDRFVYDRELGDLRYRKSVRGKGKSGAEAGYINATGYRMVKVSGRYYLCHRINRMANLRAATPSQNGANAKRWDTNRSGVKGVHWRASDQAWCAVITADKQNIRLGQFKKFDDAVAAISAARIKYHGEFARAA